ncbi:YbaY family lipoprotein [Crenobacter sp. SG2303]|uniref:YbaY family lipoprotein n=1 Tax=Crenobacter oryzisoli TaxID=3056844 RepID=A0ABT7XJH6_9NEIS|nr:YbaY family lipoprotein [Crenobacter sp. SG2303]MDN0073938.1 YbaY family lipoprotein [Crenobacter sp. SG2303]
MTAITITMKRRLLLAGLAASLLAGCATGGGYTPTYLNGSVTVPADSKLQLSKVHVKVRLLDVSQADAPAGVLAEQYLNRPRAFPMPFSLCYDRRALLPGHRYAVDAQLFVDGELKMLNAAQVPVLDQASPAEPTVSLERIGN